MCPAVSAGYRLRPLAVSRWISGDPALRGGESVIAVGFALFALFRAREPASLTLAAAFGFAALYLMINPSKASYSMAPTMMVCAAAGYLTATFFMALSRQRLLLITLIGLLIGLSVNFRLPNMLLAAGYCLYLAGAFVMARSKDTFLQASRSGWRSWPE